MFKEEDFMSTSQICILIVIIIYLVGMLYIGFRRSRSGEVKSAGDFFLGGRKLGPIVTAMSAEASDMSSYLLMGLPGLAYLTGIADVGWTVIGLAVGTYLNWLIVSKRLRRYSEKVNAITIPDFFSNRHHDSRNILSLIAALVIIIFFVPYTASGFKAIGTLFNTLFGWEYHVSMLIGAAVVVGYTVMGGFLAVSTTDLIQSIVMSIALIIIIIFGVSSVGGMSAVIANAQSLPGYFTMFGTYDASTGTGSVYGPITIVSTLAWGLGYFGMPHILLRFMAIKDESQLTTSRRVASIWVVIAMFIAVVIGVVGNAASAQGIITTLTTSSDSETIIIVLANLMAENGVLLALVAGVIMGGIMASTMSTADSQLLAASSSVSKNLLQDFFKVKLSDKMSIVIARATVAAIAVIGIFMAWNPDSSIFTIVSFAWAGFGACFGPAMLFSLFWKRSNTAGIFAGMVSGGVFVFFWKFVIRPLGGAWNIYELLPAFIVSCIFIVVVSLITKAPDESIIKEFDEVNAGR